MRLSLLAVVAGIVVAVLGNAWQGSTAASVRDDARGTARVGEAVRVRVANADLRVYVDASTTTIERTTLTRAITCGAPGISAPPRGRQVSKLDEWTLLGRIQGRPGEITVRCDAPALAAAQGLPYVVTTGGGSMTPAVAVLLVGIFTALLGTARLIVGLLVRRDRRGDRTL